MFVPSNPLASHLVHACGGWSEANELIAAINAGGGGGGSVSIGASVGGAVSGAIGNGLLYADNSNPGTLQQTAGVTVVPLNDGSGQFLIHNELVSTPVGFSINFLAGANWAINASDSNNDFQVFICDAFDGACLLTIDSAGNQTWLGDGTNGLKVIGPSLLDGSVMQLLSDAYIAPANNHAHMVLEYA